MTRVRIESLPLVPAKAGTQFFGPWIPACAGMSGPCFNLGGPPLQHPQRLQIRLQNRFLLLALVPLLLAQPPPVWDRFDVKAFALALGVDVADVVGERLFLFFQPLD